MLGATGAAGNGGAAGGTNDAMYLTTGLSQSMLEGRLRTGGFGPLRPAAEVERRGGVDLAPDGASRYVPPEPPAASPTMRITADPAFEAETTAAAVDGRLEQRPVAVTMFERFGMGKQ